MTYVEDLEHKLDFLKKAKVSALQRVQRQQQMLVYLEERITELERELAAAGSPSDTTD